MDEPVSPLTLPAKKDQQLLFYQEETQVSMAFYLTVETAAVPLLVQTSLESSTRVPTVPFHEVKRPKRC